MDSYTPFVLVGRYVTYLSCVFAFAFAQIASQFPFMSITFKNFLLSPLLQFSWPKVYKHLVGRSFFSPHYQQHLQLEK